MSIQSISGITSIQLISETALKKYTFINDNVAVEYIGPTIQRAQDLGLTPLIGTNLVDKLCTLVAGGTIGDTENVWYKDLLDNHVSKYLCNKVMEEIQIPLYAKIRNAGVVQSQDQQTQQLTRNDVNFTAEYYKNAADFYANRMIDYLRANSTHFPEWLTIRDSADMPADAKAFSTNIVL